MEIDPHFSHEHPLTLIQSEKKIRREYRNNITCKGCEKPCDFPLYACTECSFYLHKSCAELPKEFQNPFHPHPLTLVFDADISYTCQACFKGCNGIHFCCEECDIDLDVDCARLMPAVEEGSKQLQHFTHLHPLALIEGKDIKVTRRVKCLVCGEHCSGPCYGCDPCGVFLHQPCAEFEYPPKIQHYIHPCPLALHTRVHSFRCRACDTCMLGICYRCELCTFYIDVECALLCSIESEDQTQIKHFSHRHPLFSEDLDVGKQVKCFACGKNCSGPTYVCSQEFSLHKSCASVTPKIYDLLHPQHPLTLVVRTAEEHTTQEAFRCNVCCNDCNDLTYRCRLCNFNLHERCAGKLPTIKYEGHRHLLLYVEKIGLEAKCNACDDHFDSTLLRCPQCNFNLHLRCSPLPHTINHNCHIGCLNLKDSPAEDELDEEFYCNACEEEREPRYPIYCCAVCPFVAEVKCVIPEVIRLLKGEDGDVELRMPEGKIAGKVISKRPEVEKICKTEAAQAIPIWRESEVEKVKAKHQYLPFLDHLLNFFSKICEEEEAQAIRVRGDLGVEEAVVMPAITSGHRSKFFSKDEEMELRHILLDKEMEMSSAGERSNDEQDSSDISYWDKEYKEPKQKLDSIAAVDSIPAEDYLEFWEEKEQFDSVGDYLVPKSLAPILKSLVDKNVDVSVDTISPRVKMFLFVILCRTIDSMCETRVLDIKEGRLISWWRYLKALQSKGFEIKFALDHMERVVRAYLGLQLTERVQKSLFNIEEEFRKKSEEVKKLGKELEDLTVIQNNISDEPWRKSGLIAECLKEATELKWRKAGKGLQLNMSG